MKEKRSMESRVAVLEEKVFKIERQVNDIHDIVKNNHDGVLRLLDREDRRESRRQRWIKVFGIGTAIAIGWSAIVDLSSKIMHKIPWK